MGRSSDLDMVLVEEMVSRKHARIAYENEADRHRGPRFDQRHFRQRREDQARPAEGRRPRPHRHEHPQGDRPGGPAPEQLAPQPRSGRRAAPHHVAADDERVDRRGAAARSAPALLDLEKERRAGRAHRRGRGADLPEEGGHLLRDRQRPRRSAAHQVHLPDAHLAEGALRFRSAGRPRVPEAGRGHACKRF